MDKDTKAAIIAAVTPVIAGAAAAVAVATANAAVMELLATNMHTSGLTGDESIKPTDDETAISKAETAGDETEGKAAHDNVTGEEGAVKANETEGLASTGEATASESGATASRAKAGASDVETKALKMT